MITVLLKRMCTLPVARKMLRIQIEYMQNPFEGVVVVFVYYRTLITDSLTKNCLNLSIVLLKASLLRTFKNWSGASWNCLTCSVGNFLFETSVCKFTVFGAFTWNICLFSSWLSHSYQVKCCWYYYLSFCVK